MKKISAIILIFFVATFSFSNLQSSSASVFDPINGESFIYEIITSDLYSSINSEEFNVSSFQFGGHQFSGGPVEISVTGVTDDAVNYTTSCQNVSINETIFDKSTFDVKSLFMFFISYYYLYVMSVGRSIHDSFSSAGNFSSIFYSDGLSLDLMMYFIGTGESNWNFLENLAYDLNNSSSDLIQYGDFYFLPSSAIYYESDNVVSFESWFNGVLSIPNNFQAKISNGFTFAYNKSNGVLLGLRTKGTFDGEIDGDSVYCSTEFHIELENYNLNDFTLYTDPSITEEGSLSFMHPIFTFIVIIPLITFIQRRKQC
ncbi:MAG: choice-of-anchor S family protein [Asgard group archaeon]|nr:choice-of-anchor S family protein [Asgard group archaeon]